MAPAASRWKDLADRPATRAVLVVLAAAVAYRYSLRTLISSVGTETPLAYLGLAPLIAFAVALLVARPGPGAPQVTDRNIDYLIGVPLLGTALFMTAALPARMSILYWYYRVDLLSLPIFVAGAVALVFGASTLYRVRYAVGFLILAWPAPYNYALEHGLTRFTGLTLGSLHRLVGLLEVATVQPGGDGSVFVVHHGTSWFTLSVASACTGVDSFVGFLLVGLAVMTVVEGSKLGRVLWMATGILLAFALNLVRLVLIFWVGGRFGERVALDGLHPVLGLVLFCAGVAVMVSGLRLFGLDVRQAAPRAPAAGTWRLAGGVRLAGAAVAAVAAMVAVADGGFVRYGPLAGSLGSPRVAAFTDDPIVPAGWTVQPVTRYPWAGQYFGHGAIWIRYQFAPAAGAPGSATVLADVIDTTDLQSFSNYDVLACYGYHGYSLSAEHRAPLGQGVVATGMTFHVPGLPGLWNGLYWVWPVRAGGGIEYERILLLDPADGAYPALAPGSPAPSTRPVDFTGGLGDGRAFLQSFAEQMVSQRAGSAPAGALTAAPAGDRMDAPAGAAR